MEYQDVRLEVAKALRRYGFYLFDKSKQEAVREILRLLGDLRSLLRVRSLPQSPDHLILEVDVYQFEASCRDRCGRNGVVDPHCYNKCVLEASRGAVERITAALGVRPREAGHSG